MVAPPNDGPPANAFNSSFESRSSSLEIRRFQNIIQPCLLEFGYIKSDRQDNRLFGCEYYSNNGGPVADVPQPVIASESSTDLQNPTSCA